MRFEEGACVADYELLRVLGAGSQGEVWEARGGEDDRPVTCALKVIFPERERHPAAMTSRMRWEREVLIGAAVLHDCLPQVLDAGQDDAGLWIAMQLVQGESLESRYASRAVSNAQEFAAVMVCLCAALDALHKAPLDNATGVIHRDVKPANVVVRGWGSEAFATLVDLGTAKPLDGAATELIGTPEYLAPEQIACAELGAELDVWAAGAVALWMLAGRAPFPRADGESAHQYVQRRESESCAPRVEAHEVPAWAVGLLPSIVRAMAHAPQDRPAALGLAREIVAVVWPEAVPPALAPLLAGFDLHAAESAALRGAGRFTHEVEPGAGLFELADRVVARTEEGMLWRAAALLHARGGRRDAAAAAWHAAHAAGDPSAAAYHAAEVEARDGQELAYPLWERADHDGSPAAAFRLALIARDAGQREAEIVLLRRARSRGHDEAGFRLYELLAGSSDSAAEARDALSFSASRGNPAALFTAAGGAFARGRISQAERLWKLAASRGSARAPSKLADLHLRRGEPQAALDCLAGSRGSRAALLRGHALVALGQASRARVQWEQARADGEGGASCALARAAWERRDWPAVETLRREALERGHTHAALPLGVALQYQGRPDEAEAAYRMADPSVDRSLALACAHAQREDRAAASAALDECAAWPQLPEQWLLKEARGTLEWLAEEHTCAAFFRAELLRLTSTADDERAQAAFREAYAHAAALGDLRSTRWVVQLMEDADERRRGLEDLLPTDENGWAPYELARIALDAGERERGEQLMRNAAERGLVAAMTAAETPIDDAHREALMRRADAAGNAWAADRLGDLLSATLGGAHPEVEAAYSRADLRGSAAGAVDLGLVLYAQHGATPAVEQAWERGKRRGSGTGVFNLGTLHVARGDIDRAARCYRDAIDLGDTEGHVALAELERDRGRTGHAMELARAADARHPSRRSALLMGDLLLGEGERFGAVEAYLRADALGDPRAPIELAELLDDVDALAALDRALLRATDDTAPLWNTLSPTARATHVARIERLRRRIERDD